MSRKQSPIRVPAVSKTLWCVLLATCCLWRGDYAVRAERPLDKKTGGASPTEVEVRQTLTIAVVSSHSRFADVDYNLKHFETRIKEAASRGARLICFPELSLVGYTCHPDVLKAAEPIPGPATRKL